MKKITKKQNATFIKSCEIFLENEGGRKVETSDLYYGKHYIFESEELGKLAIKIDDDNSKLYSIYAKFENEKIASKYFDCNSHSGKYNLHTFHYDEPVIWMQRLLYEFNNISLMSK